MTWYRVFHVLIDEALDVELAEHDPLSRPVVTEPPLIFVNFPFRVLRLRWVFVPILDLDKAPVQYRV